VGVGVVRIEPGGVDQRGPGQALRDGPARPVAILLLLVGYVWLLEIGVGSSWIASVTAIAFGVGAALALDEFALWLNLSDVYWERQGRLSIDAVLIFGGLLSVGIWGWPFFRGLTSLLRRHNPLSGGA
jgi:hypothetical protein